MAGTAQKRIVLNFAVYSVLALVGAWVFSTLLALNGQYTSAELLCSQALGRVDGPVTCRLPRAECTFSQGITICTDTGFTLLIRGNRSNLDGSCILVIDGEASIAGDSPHIEATRLDQVYRCEALE